MVEQQLLEEQRKEEEQLRDNELQQLKEDLRKHDLKVRESNLEDDKNQDLLQKQSEWKAAYPSKPDQLPQHQYHSLPIIRRDLSAESSIECSFLSIILFFKFRVLVFALA